MYNIFHNNPKTAEVSNFLFNRNNSITRKRNLEAFAYGYPTIDFKNLDNILVINNLK